MEAKKGASRRWHDDSHDVPRKGTTLSLSQPEGKFTVAVFAAMFAVMYASDWLRWCLGW